VGAALPRGCTVSAGKGEGKKADTINPLAMFPLPAAACHSFLFAGETV
jgi:hypothetical protein